MRGDRDRINHMGLYPESDDAKKLKDIVNEQIHLDEQTTDRSPTDRWRHIETAICDYCATLQKIKPSDTATDELKAQYTKYKDLRKSFISNKVTDQPSTQMHKILLVWKQWATLNVQQKIRKK